MNILRNIAAVVAGGLLLSGGLSCSAERLEPEGLEYKGAFRLPDDEEWEYSGYAATYYPEGDPGGEADGYPGSLYILGHDQKQRVAEVSIPVPVIASDKDANKLNRAVSLQGFHDITAGMFGELEIPRADFEYLPAQGSQTTGKLHFCWGQHFQDFQPSHGWCELDLSQPQPAGPWHFGEYTNYVTNDYLFAIPEEWADANTPGQLLATGRFRDGNWGGQGPALFAYGPWNEGNPPAANATLKNITALLLYGTQESGAIEITNSDSMKMKDFKEPDEWSGAAWLCAGDKSAVIFAGTKAIGKCWYGFANGVVWPTDVDDATVYPEVPQWPNSNRGWWSQDSKAQIIFYDTDELAAVAGGAMKSHEPQPYAALDIDTYLFDPGVNLEKEKRYSLGAACFDRGGGRLFVIERRADGDRSLVHVWQIKPTN